MRARVCVSVCVCVWGGEGGGRGGAMLPAAYDQTRIR